MTSVLIIVLKMLKTWTLFFFMRRLLVYAPVFLFYSEIYNRFFWRRQAQSAGRRYILYIVYICTKKSSCFEMVTRAASSARVFRQVVAEVKWSRLTLNWDLNSSKKNKRRSLAKEPLKEKWEEPKETRVFTGEAFR